MIDLVKKIFIDKGYKTRSAFNEIEKPGFIGYFDSKEKSDYYFVIEIDISSIRNIAQIEESIDEIIDKYWDTKILSEYGVRGDYKKNSSLIILLKLKDLTEEFKISNNIYDIEESPFFFKRYVLTYTDKQEILLKDKKIITNNIDDYRKIISNRENFSIFKRRRVFGDIKQEEESKKESKKETKEIELYLLYDIISKLYIKIPFLNYNYNGNNEIESLEERITNVMDETGKSIGEKIVNTNSDESIDYNKLVEYLEDPLEEAIDNKYKDLIEEIRGV